MGSRLNYRILVLNRLWQAVNIVGAERGFSLLLQDHAQVIHTDDGSYALLSGDEWIRRSVEETVGPDEPHVCTVRWRIRIPKVLLLRRFDKVPTQEVKFNRTNLFERDSYRCQYCGEVFDEEDLNMDHVIPRDRGGRTSWENIVTSCIRCNSRKANRLPHQAGMSLIRRPERPRWRPFVTSLIHEDYDEDWEHFIKMKAV